MKKILFSAALVVATMMAVMSGCQSYKQVPYIQNSDSIDYALAKGLYDARIMPKDILSIYVSTPENNEVSKQFNLSARPNRGNYGDQSNSTQTYETIQRYLNRLSDYLFVLGRHAVVAKGQQEDLYTN